MQSLAALMFSESLHTALDGGICAARCYLVRATRDLGAAKGFVFRLEIQLGLYVAVSRQFPALTPFPPFGDREKYHKTPGMGPTCPRDRGVGVGSCRGGCPGCHQLLWGDQSKQQHDSPPSPSPPRFPHSSPVCPGCPAEDALLRGLVLGVQGMRTTAGKCRQWQGAQPKPVAGDSEPLYCGSGESHAATMGGARGPKRRWRWRRIPLPRWLQPLRLRPSTLMPASSSSATLAPLAPPESQAPPSHLS